MKIQSGSALGTVPKGLELLPPRLGVVPLWGQDWAKAAVAVRIKAATRGVALFFIQILLNSSVPHSITPGPCARHRPKGPDVNRPKDPYRVACGATPRP